MTLQMISEMTALSTSLVIEMIGWIARVVGRF